ncbi:MAG: hypothetical protein ACJAT5_000176 [Lentimonas sp.]|jgi:hypothetical protein
MTRPAKAAEKSADPQTLAVAPALAAAEAEIEADAEAPNEAEAEAEAEAEREAAAEAVALSAAEKLKPGANTPNPKIEIRSCKGVKRAITKAKRGKDIKERTDSSKAKFALSVGIIPAIKPIDADALRSIPSPIEHEAEALSIADNEAPMPNERPIDILALMDALKLAPKDKSRPSDAARPSDAHAARLGIAKRGSCASILESEGSDAPSCSMANAADGDDRSKPSDIDAIRDMFAVMDKFAIMEASNERPSEAPKAALALKSADALALRAADALRPKLAAADKDIPGISRGSPAVIESKLLREARQAHDISL